MRREQKTAKAGYPCEGMLETESSKGGRSMAFYFNMDEFWEWKREQELKKDDTSKNRKLELNKTNVVLHDCIR